MNPNKFDKLIEIRKKNKSFSKSKEQLNIENRRYKTENMFFKGIYRLYLNDEIVYIGKSDVNVMKRICDHYFEKTKLFDSFTFTSCNDLNNSELSELESKLIKKYNPKYNILNLEKWMKEISNK